MCSRESLGEKKLHKFTGFTLELAERVGSDGRLALPSSASKAHQLQYFIQLGFVELQVVDLYFRRWILVKSSPTRAQFDQDDTCISVSSAVERRSLLTL